MSRTKICAQKPIAKRTRAAKATTRRCGARDNKDGNAGGGAAQTRQECMEKVFLGELNCVTNLSAAITKLGNDIQAGAFNYHMACPPASSPIFSAEDMRSIHEIAEGAGLPNVASFFSMLDELMPEVEERLYVGESMIETPAFNHIRHCVFRAVVLRCVYHYSKFCSLFGTTGQ